ncbi:MAG: hypothetical protein R2909_20010 [Gemmatimonadales bacterium]
MRRDLVQRYAHLLPWMDFFNTTITLASTSNVRSSTCRSTTTPRLGASKIRARHAYDFTLLVLRVIIYFNPLKVFIPAGALMALAGLVKLGYDIIRDNLLERVSRCSAR